MPPGHAGRGFRAPVPPQAPTGLRPWFSSVAGPSPPATLGVQASAAQPAASLPPTCLPLSPLAAAPSPRTSGSSAFAACLGADTSCQLFFGSVLFSVFERRGTAAPVLFLGGRHSRTLSSPPNHEHLSLSWKIRLSCHLAKPSDNFLSLSDVCTCSVHALGQQSRQPGAGGRSPWAGTGLIRWPGRLMASALGSGASVNPESLLSNGDSPRPSPAVPAPSVYLPLNADSLRYSRGD